MEGAVWLGKKMTNEVERLCQFIDSASGDFQDRLSEEEF
jgi:hypothetical protein